MYCGDSSQRNHGEVRWTWAWVGRAWHSAPQAQHPGAARPRLARTHRSGLVLGLAVRQALPPTHVFAHDGHSAVNGLETKSPKQANRVRLQRCVHVLLLSLGDGCEQVARRRQACVLKGGSGRWPGFAQRRCTVVATRAISRAGRLRLRLQQRSNSSPHAPLAPARHGATGAT